MIKLFILVNNMSMQMASEVSGIVEKWLEDDTKALVLPSGLDLGVPVSIEAILLDVDPAGHIRDAVRLPGGPLP